MFTGDIVFVIASTDGPDAGAWMYRASSGKQIGVVGPGPGSADDGGYLNLFRGSYELVEPNRFVARDTGFHEATVDVATGKVAMKVDKRAELLVLAAGDAKPKALTLPLCKLQ